MSNKRHNRIGPHIAPAGRFTGAAGSDSKKGQKSTRKERRQKRGSHVDKYEK